MLFQLPQGHVRRRHRCVRRHSRWSRRHLVLHSQGVGSIIDLYVVLFFMFCVSFQNCLLVTSRISFPRSRFFLSNDPPGDARFRPRRRWHRRFRSGWGRPGRQRSPKGRQGHAADCGPGQPAVQRVHLLCRTDQPPGVQHRRGGCLSKQRSKVISLRLC